MRQQIEQVDRKQQQQSAGSGREQELTAPVLREFRDLLAREPRLRMYFSAMWDEVPRKKPYFADPTGARRQIRDADHMLAVLDHVLTRPPQWHDAAAGVGMVGVPLVTVFDYVMATPR